MVDKTFKEVWDQLPFDELKKSLLIEAKRSMPQKIHITIFDKTRKGEDRVVDEEVFERSDLNSGFFSSILSNAQSSLLKIVADALVSASCLKNEVSSHCVLDLGGPIQVELIVHMTETAVIHWNGIRIVVTNAEIKDLTV